MSHTPEPWRVEYHSSNGYEIWADTSPTGSMRLCALGFASTFDKDNARRIVACVNACAGVPLEWLESGLDGCVQGVREERDQYAANLTALRAALQTHAEEAAKLIEQRDELLGAAIAVVDRWDSPLWANLPHTGEFIARLRAATTKATHTTNERK